MKNNNKYLSACQQKRSQPAETKGFGAVYRTKTIYGHSMQWEGIESSPVEDTLLGKTWVPPVVNHTRLIHDQRVANLHTTFKNTLMYFAPIITKYGHTNPSMETIAYRIGRSPRTAQRHVDVLVKAGVLKRSFRHHATSIFTLDPWFMKFRDSYRGSIAKIAFLSVSLLCVSTAVSGSRVTQYKDKFNTNKTNVIYNKHLSSNLREWLVTREGVVVSAIPPYVMAIDEISLEPAGAIELSAFEEQDIFYARKALRRQKEKLFNPFAWFLSVCKVSASNGGREPNWVLVSQLKQVANVTDKSLRYKDKENTSGFGPYGSSSMITSQTSTPNKGKAVTRPAEYVHVERNLPEEHPLVAACKVAANCVRINYYIGNPWWDKLTDVEKNIVITQYPSYAHLARINLPHDKKEPVEEVDYMYDDESSVWQEIYDDPSFPPHSVKNKNTTTSYETGTARRFKTVGSAIDILFKI